MNLWRQAGREVSRYVLWSGVVFLANTMLYVLYFLLTKPKYTFLTGNSFILLMTIAQCAAAFWYTCLRKKGREAATDLVVFRAAISSIVAGLLTLYGLHATVFTIVERSVSINVLRYLAEGEAQPYDRIEKNFINTFVFRDKAVCKRLDEQLHLGNVARQDGRYAITPKGARTFRILDLTMHVTADKAPQNSVSCEGP